MFSNAEELLKYFTPQQKAEWEENFKLNCDPRITRVGRFIRKCSIDELPQLLNVIKGDMSIVGPRPPIPREVALYNADQRLRLSVKPGITCFWQVMQDRNEIAFDDWVALDMKYIHSRSLWLDYKIILLTIKAVVLGFGV